MYTLYGLCSWKNIIYEGIHVVKHSLNFAQCNCIFSKYIMIPLETIVQLILRNSVMWLAIQKNVVTSYTFLKR
jgi:hypothetical protein